MKRILIGQLGVYGDCLYATAIARQIKHDYPDCHLTWAIGSAYKSVLDNNPHVDTIWEYPVASRWDVTNKWFEFEAEALALKKRGDFDLVYLTQAYPGNAQNFYESLRVSMFRTYSVLMTVPITPVVRLTPDEIENVRKFAVHHHLAQRKNVILFEYSPQSGQSFLTTEIVKTIVKDITRRFPDTSIILSGNVPVHFINPDIIDGSVLTFRENAELTKYCTLFIGTGSGITQICMSDWAKPLPMLQLLQQGTVASVISDHNYFGLPTDQIIEITRCSEIKIIECLECILTHGFSLAREMYCEHIVPDFKIIRFRMMFTKATLTGRYFDIFPVFLTTCMDYGFSWDLVRFLMSFLENAMKLFNRKIKGGKWLW